MSYIWRLLRVGFFEEFGDVAGNKMSRVFGFVRVFKGVGGDG